MARYAIRRILFAIPTLIAVSFILFAILDLAPGDPTGQLPLTIPAEVREAIRESLGLNDPFLVKWIKWMQLMFINEPFHLVGELFDVCIGDCDNRARIISWSSRGPAMDIIIERLPQTMWVMGLAFAFGVMIAIPVGVLSAYKQYSWFDNAGTFFTMLGFSIPTFFTGLLAVTTGEVVPGVMV